MINKIAQELDKIAEILEGMGLIKEAYDLDIVSNTLEKEAAYNPRDLMGDPGQPNSGAIGNLAGRLLKLREIVKGGQTVDHENVRAIQDGFNKFLKHFSMLDSGYVNKIREYGYGFIPEAHKDLKRFVDIAQGANVENPASLKKLGDLGYDVLTLAKTWHSEKDNINNLTFGYPIINKGDHPSQDHPAPYGRRQPDQEHEDTKDINDPKARAERIRRYKELSEKERQREESQSKRPSNFSTTGLPGGYKWEKVDEGGLGRPNFRDIPKG